MSQTTKKCLSYAISLVGALTTGLLCSYNAHQWMWVISLIVTVASELWHIYVIL